MTSAILYSLLLNHSLCGAHSIEEVPQQSNAVSYKHLAFFLEQIIPVEVGSLLGLIRVSCNLSSTPSDDICEIVRHFNAPHMHAAQGTLPPRTR
jgi:hypothetical protein